MKIEVGEYIRTIDGYIRKIDNINTDKQKITYYGKYILDMPYKNSQAVAEKKIKAHSFNIIDLIEVGDYVNGRRIDKKFTIKINPVTSQKYLEYNYGLEDIINDFEIKSIVTEENFLEMEYRINE